MRLFNIYLLLQYGEMHGSSHAYWCIDAISVQIMYLYLFISNKATLQLQIPVCLSICQIFWCRFLSSMIIYSLPFCPLASRSNILFITKVWFCFCTFLWFMSIFSIYFLSVFSALISDIYILRHLRPSGPNYI